eukprot:TRINITY_DN621_c0_g2_i1.p1 TRINITY_DN621_c0_g2~~TRINITY_DN621_c0_g2_i1.p1  ORF type:complete len:591 (+),score=116.70 TRINITY_DN621_c0_g2_i1:190-1773(+)
MVESITAPKTPSTLKLSPGPSKDKASLFEYSPDGTLLAVVACEGASSNTGSTGKKFSVQISRTSSGEDIHVLNTPAEAKALIFSPLGSFLVTLEKKNPKDNAEAKNLKLWSTSDGSLLQSWHSGSAPGDSSWPPLQWSEDEKLCGYIVNSGILFYENNNFKEIVHKVSMERIRGFSIAPGKHKPYKVAVFIPEFKGSPAFVRIYDFPNFDAPVASKSFYKAQRVQLDWNCHGSALVIEAMTEDDQSGKSYYGETNLYYLQSNGKFDTNISLKKPGPIHMVRWSPTGNEFGIVYGHLPSKTTIFDLKCRPKRHLPEAARNTIIWSPCGRLLFIGGFATLSGDVDVWEWNAQRKVGVFKAFCSSYQEWSPDSQFILTAILSPRMRVDNGIKIFNYNGELVFEQSISDLYRVGWCPAKGFPQIPLIYKELPTDTGGAETKSVYTPPGAYKHPNFARSQAGPVGSTPKKAQPDQIPGSTPKFPVGGEKAESEEANLSRNARRNRARRAKRKAKKDGEDQTSTDNQDAKDEE